MAKKPIGNDLPRLIFCLSPGRCGTRYLASLLNAILGVHAEHEGTPNFVDVARAARRDQHEAFCFWDCEKLPYIRSLGTEVYADTSHLFGKGFVRPLLDLGVVPDTIVLKRNRRDVALSFWRRGSIPARTPRGQRYLLHPEQAKHCPFPRWWAASDYMLCYWYVLEMEERIKERVKWLREAGGEIVFLPFEKLISDDMPAWIDQHLGLPPHEVTSVRGDIINATPKQVSGIMPPGDIDEQEAAVKEAVVYAGHSESDPRIKIDVVVLAMETIRKELAITLLSLARDRRYNIAISFMAANPTSNTRCQISLEFKDNERRPDWLMMIDEDTIPNGDFLRWVESDYDVISFVAPCWKPATSPESPIVWNLQLEEGVEKFLPATSGMVLELRRAGPITEPASAGTGAILIRRAVLEHPHFRAPFQDRFDEHGIRIIGHDIDFCRRAKVAGFKVGSVLTPASHYKAIDLLAVARMLGGSKS